MQINKVCVLSSTEEHGSKGIMELSAPKMRASEKLNHPEASVLKSQLRD
jgi:hypothetical protein